MAPRCPNCGTELPGNPRECPVCGYDQDLRGAALLPLPSQRANDEQLRERLTPEQRTAILDGEIRHYTAMGYEVLDRTSDTAQLIKRRRFSCGMMLLGCLTVIPWVVYLIYYTFKRDTIVHLQVDEWGRVLVTE